MAALVPPAGELVRTGGEQSHLFPVPNVLWGSLATCFLSLRFSFGHVGYVFHPPADTHMVDPYASSGNEGGVTEGFSPLRLPCCVSLSLSAYLVLCEGASVITMTMCYT